MTSPETPCFGESQAAPFSSAASWRARIRHPHPGGNWFSGRDCFQAVVIFLKKNPTPGDASRDLFGMVSSRDLLKRGCSWPPTIGDEKGTLNHWKIYKMIGSNIRRLFVELWGICFFIQNWGLKYSPSPENNHMTSWIFQPAIRFRGTLIPGSPFLSELTFLTFSLGGCCSVYHENRANQWENTQGEPTKNTPKMSLNKTKFEFLFGAFGKRQFSDFFLGWTFSGFFWVYVSPNWNGWWVYVTFQG